MKCSWFYTSTLKLHEVSGYDPEEDLHEDEAADPLKELPPLNPEMLMQALSGQLWTGEKKVK